MEAQITDKKSVKEMTVLSLMLEYDRLQRRPRLSETDISRKNAIRIELSYRIED